MFQHHPCENVIKLFFLKGLLRTLLQILQNHAGVLLQQGHGQVQPPEPATLPISVSEENHLPNSRPQEHTIVLNSAEAERFVLDHF